MTESDWTVDPALAETVDVAARTWRQGDVFSDVALVHYALADKALTAAASRSGSGPVAVRQTLTQAAIVSQTCEVVRSCLLRPMVHIAAVVKLSGPVLLEARHRWRPQFVAVPWVAPDHYVDLEVQGMVEKSVLLNSTRVAECPNATESMQFSEGIARHRSRFAFPDDLAPTLAPLMNRFREKAGKDTPQGRRIAEIVEVRARAAPDWYSEQVSVELAFIVEPDQLPPEPDDVEPTPELLAEIGSLGAQRLAELLDDGAIEPSRRNALWQRLVDAWCTTAKPTGTIREVTGVAIPMNEFTVADARLAPQLDLDHLSS